jgi:P27 family predicted phage terminase small subunit
VGSKKTLQPPEDIEGEVLDEWNRVIAAGEEIGRQWKAADRSILATYCRTWIVNRECFQHVKTFGSVIKWPNGLPGASPQYKNFKLSLYYVSCWPILDLLHCRETLTETTQKKKNRTWNSKGGQ